LLGAERAVIDGALVRRDEIGGRCGEPVLHLVDVAQRDEFVREVEIWFSRGGGALRLVHFGSRDAVGVELQKVFKHWRCPTCKSSFASPTRQLIEDASPCPRCRGEGWLVVEDERFVACEDCDGFGSVSQFAAYKVGAVALKKLSGVTLRDVVTELPSLSHLDRERLLCVCDAGFSRYPLGAPVELLSKGERVLATIVSATLSGIDGLSLAVDVGGLGASDAWCDSLRRVESKIPLKLFSAQPDNVPAPPRSEPSAEVFTLRDLFLGPLSIDSISFDISRASLLQGAAGSGKTLFLQETARRFAKRKKLAHLASFGALKRCHLIDAYDSGDRTVLELLGLSAELASEAARSRLARERGLSDDDFLVGRSKLVCSACSGIPAVRDERCPQCDGGLFDRRVGEVMVNNVAFGDLLRRPLAEVGSVLWANDAIAAVIDRLPDTLKTTVSLGDAAGTFSPPARRFLKVYAPLIRILSTKGSLKGDLFLLDVPFGTSSAHQAAIIHCIRELQERSATILCAGVPETLENLFSSVVRLRPVDSGAQDGKLSRYFDVRMAQKSEVSIIR
jgi:Zn-finger nucleic acid-binding protein